MNKSSVTVLSIVYSNIANLVNISNIIHLQIFMRVILANKSLSETKPV